MKGEAQRVPGATYRLQFNSQFRFREAIAIVPYLHALGITHCYASPIFQASPGSTHGYDVCEFDQFNPALGTAAEFKEFSECLNRHGMGLILDMVPNHMGGDLSNGWWRDVLECGRESRFAGYFDVDWSPLDPALRGKVLLPVLEAPLGTVLDAGKLRLGYAGGEFFVSYYEKQFPVAPHSYPKILADVIESVGEKEQDGLRERLRQISRSFEQFSASQGAKELPTLKSELHAVLQQSKRLRVALEAALDPFHGVSGQPATFDRLHRLLQEQHYRLAYWRTGSEELNYRRFFDVTGLVSLRMELPEVFEASHCLVFRLLAAGQISGLRIDHPDGLWDPKTYFEHLRERAPPLSYLVAEKILSDEEDLPEDWPIDGSTGYEFLNVVNGIFVDSGHEAQFNHLYSEFTGKTKSFADTGYGAKRRVLEKSFVSEINALAHRLKNAANQSRYSQDFTWSQIRRALVDLAACFPVYRTYISEWTSTPAESQRRYIETAVNRAKQHLDRGDVPVLDFVGDLLLLKFPRDLTEDNRREYRRFILKFQQLTGPAAAKGIEDTAFYRYNRLISLNEVGGNPGRFGFSVTQFHEFNQRRAKTWPHSLLATATHDTKRGEETRAIINVLSEIPAEWGAAVRRWSAVNATHKTVVSGKAAPHPNDELLLYQTLVGAWPTEQISASVVTDLKPKELDTFRERIVAYMLKAIKEAKLLTSWTDPDPQYEQATTQFVQAVLDPANESFLHDVSVFHGKVAFFGRLNSLGQVLLKITSPGVPDFYQGTEFWDLSLVDPDNRRPVDFGIRQHELAELKAAFSDAGPADSESIQQLRDRGWGSGLIKLYVMYRALLFRNAHRELFDAGEYIPLEVQGERKEHVCAFARKTQDQMAVVVVPRLCWRLTKGAAEFPVGSDVWNDTRIEGSILNETSFKNVLTGGIVSGQGKPRGSILRVGDLLASFPVALVHTQVGNAEAV